MCGLHHGDVICQTRTWNAPGADATAMRDILTLHETAADGIEVESALDYSWRLRS